MRREGGYWGKKYSHRARPAPIIYTAMINSITTNDPHSSAAASYHSLVDRSQQLPEQQSTDAAPATAPSAPRTLEGDTPASTAASPLAAYHQQSPTSAQRAAVTGENAAAVLSQEEALHALGALDIGI